MRRSRRSPGSSSTGRLSIGAEMLPNRRPARRCLSAPATCGCARAAMPSTSRCRRKRALFAAGMRTRSRRLPIQLSGCLSRAPFCDARGRRRVRPRPHRGKRGRQCCSRARADRRHAGDRGLRLRGEKARRRRARRSETVFCERD
jgi:hypothetical protein